MSTMTRRSALAAGAALVVPVEPTMEPVDENPRSVFVPRTRNAFPESDLDTLHAKLLWQRTCEAFEPEEWSRVFGSDDTGNTWPHARHLDLRGCVLAVGW
jgi:predicted nucleic acid-binding Zn ribbon protein